MSGAVSDMFNTRCLPVDTSLAAVYTKLVLVYRVYIQVKFNEVTAFQNTLVRVIAGLGKFDHVTAVLKALHRLSIENRVTLNCMTTLTHNL